MRYELTERQIGAFESLLSFGEREDILSADYKLFGLNQTRVSKYSPGVNAVKQLKKMKRFSYCGELGHEECGKDDAVSWNFDMEPR
jgi:hypothetical protein